MAVSSTLLRVCFHVTVLLCNDGSSTGTRVGFL